MLLFVQPLSGNSLINCQAPGTINNHTDFWSKFCILYWMAPCWQAVRRNFQKFPLFSVYGLKIEKLIKKSKPTRKLRHANSILKYFEYFCQMSSKLILIILSYTVSKLAGFFWDTVYIKNSLTCLLTNNYFKTIMDLQPLVSTVTANE